VAMAIGGTILFVAVIIMLYNLFALMRTPRGDCEFPLGEVSEHADATPPILERWRVWIIIAVVLIIIAYAIPIYTMITNTAPGSPGFTTW
jgi:cytochrome c oxidase subunit I